MQLNDLRVNLTLDNTGFRLSVAESGRVLRQFEQRLGSTADRMRRTEGYMESFGQRASRMVQTLGMARFAVMDLNDIFLSFPRAIMSSAGEIERMTQLMKGLSKEVGDTAKQAEAVSNVKFVFNLAKNAPFEVKALTDTFVKLKTGGMDPLDGSMQALVNSVAKFGGSSEQLHRASIAIQQMGGKGVISMEELRQQLGEAVPTAMQAMAVGMKMSMSQLSKAVSDGTVASGMAMKKMLAVMMVDNAAAASDMMDTWTGKLEQLKTTWELWKLDVAGEGFAETMKEGLDDLIETLGSGDARSFGRSIGQSMNSAAVAIIQFTKDVSKMWEEIKLAGELLLYYFAASKIAPMLASGQAAMSRYVASIRAGSAAVRADMLAEARERNAQRLATIRMVEETVTRNNAVIASEQARANATRAIRARELADQIAANRIQLRLDAQRLAAANAAIAAASPANSSAVRAVQRGTATAAQDLEAQVLLRHAEAARIDTAAINARTTALTAQNRAMGMERAALTNSVAGLTAESAARSAANARLMETARRLRANGQEITRFNIAMANMRAAATGVITGISSMIFSMGGLITIIMAAAWAWSHFSDKAKEAAKNAQLAADADRRFKEGKVNEDTVAGFASSIKDKEERINDLSKTTVNSDGTSTNGAMKFSKEQTAKNAAQLDKLKAELAKDRAAFARESSKVAEMQGEESGRAMFDTYYKGIEKSLQASETNVVKVTKKYDDMVKASGKLSAENEKKKIEELHAARVQALRYTFDNIGKEEERLTKEVEANAEKRSKMPKTGLSQEQINAAITETARLQTQLHLVQEKRSNVAEALSNLNAPNDINTKPDDPNKDKRNKLDSVQRAIISERNSLAKAETGFSSLLGDALDVRQLKSDYQAEIEALREGDKDRGIKPKSGTKEEKELVDLKVQAATMDRIKNLYGGLAKKRKEIEEEFQLNTLRTETGNFQLQGKGDAEKVVDRLEEDLRIALARAEPIKGEAEKLRKALDDAKAILYNERQNTGMEAMEGNRRSIETLRIGNIVNDRARMAAEQQLERQELRKKYDAQIQAHKEGSAMRLKLEAQSNQEALLLAERHANDMKTPLEKLGQAWEDVAGNMEKATADWASSTIDAFVNTTLTGKQQFGDLVKSILADLLKIQLQATMGSAVKGIAGYIGDFAKNYIGGSQGVNISEADLNKLPMNFPKATPHANGGIMSSLGPLPLKKYSMGGIANSPQLALFGEGSMNEAYVPLPDGRSIPVTIQGGMPQQQPVMTAPNIAVNVINQSGTQMNAEQGGVRFDGKQFVLDVVMTAARTPGPFRSNMKDALK